MKVYGQLEKAQIEYGDINTESPMKNRLLVHTGDNLPYMGNGTVWNSLAAGPILGEIKMFKQFAGLIAVPVGWFPLTAGAGIKNVVLNEANYETIHGVGTWVTHGVSTSILAGKKLPNLNGYDVNGSYVAAVPVDGDDGVADSTVFGANEKNIAHTHSTPTHSHLVASRSANGDMVDSADAGDMEPAFISGNGTGAEQWETGDSGGTTGSGGSATQDFRPQSFQAMFIMRVI